MNWFNKIWLIEGATKAGVQNIAAGFSGAIEGGKGGVINTYAGGSGYIAVHRCKTLPDFLVGWVITQPTKSGDAAKLISPKGDYVYLTVGNSKAGYARLVKAFQNMKKDK